MNPKETIMDALEAIVTEHGLAETAIALGAIVGQRYNSHLGTDPKIQAAPMSDLFVAQESIEGAALNLERYEDPINAYGFVLNTAPPRDS